MSMISRQKLNQSVCTGALALVVSFPATTLADDDPITWRVQTHHPQGSVSYEDSVMFFKERIEERTDGRLQLEIYEAGSLFGWDQIFPAVSRGTIPMGTVGAGYFLDYSELAGIAFGLPNSFNDVWEALHFWRNHEFEETFREHLLEEHDLYWTTSLFYPTEMVVTDRIDSLEDLEAMQIRLTGTLQEFMTEVGAAASTLGGEEIYQALSTGVIDGASWGHIAGAHSMNFYEVAKYHVRPPLNISSNGFIINQEAIEELPDDVREILYQTLDEQVWHTTARSEYGEKVLLREIQEELGVEVIELPDDVQARMDEVAERLWNQEAERGELAAQAVADIEAFMAEIEDR